MKILGETYKFIYVEDIEDNRVPAVSGFTDWTTKTIAVEKTVSDAGSYGDLKEFDKSISRHEIIHAFLDESGLMNSSEWARNEEMVDWFALQWYKIAEVIKKAEKIIEG